MRAASLLVVFLLAKGAVLWGHAVPWNSWAAAAYVWQDALVVLLFAGIDAGLRKFGAKRLALALYWALAIYAAINIPVGRVVSTPLTWPMLRAARGPLADSILLYVTWPNVLLVSAILVSSGLLPWLLRRTPRRWLMSAACAVVPLVLVGPAASSRVDAHGLDRNPVAVLVRGALPRRAAGKNGDDWRISHFPGAAAEDLRRYSGLAKGRNVIAVSLESTAAQYLRLYGSAYDVMPNLDTLARDALVFENAYAVYPESIKGLYSVMCSAYPPFQSELDSNQDSVCRSVADLLARAGYRTAMFHSGRFAYLGMESLVRHRGFQTLEDAGDIGGNHNSSFGVDEPSTVARLLAWIDGLPRGEHFFVTYLPIAGHHPYATPGRGPFEVHAEIDQYRNALHYGDESLGELARGLRDRGLDRNTVWVIYGDHGEAFHQHDGNYGHTFFIFDENVHVPLVIAAPGLMSGQSRIRKTVSLLDVAPTLLDLLGMEPHVEWSGRSALDSKARMALFYTDYSLGIVGLRDGRWKFVYEMDSRRGKLFDMDCDPGERSDASATEPERAAWYGSLVRGWIGR